MKIFFKVLFILVIFSLISSCDDVSYDPVLPERGSSGSPPVMGKVYAEQTSTTTAAVTWSATDDLTPQNELSYDVHLSQQANFTPDATTRKATVLGATKTDLTNLETGKTYYILIIATDKNGFKSVERDYKQITLLGKSTNSIPASLSMANLKIVHITDPNTNLGLIVTNINPNKQGSAASLKNLLTKKVPDFQRHFLANNAGNLPSNVRQQIEQICKNNIGITDNSSLLDKCITAGTTCYQSGITDSTPLEKCIIDTLLNENVVDENVLAFFGQKNQKGYLTTIDQVMLVSSNNPNNAIQVNFNSDASPKSVKLPSGSTYSIPPSNPNNPPIIDNGSSLSPLPEDTVKGITQAVKNYTQFVQNNDPLGNDLNGISCAEMLNTFLDVTYDVLDKTSTLLSAVACVGATAGLIMSAGLDLPIFLWACGTYALSLNNKADKDLKNSFDAVDTAKSCTEGAAGCAVGVAKTLVKVAKNTGLANRVCHDPNKGSANGDPHFYTFDGLAYDFQGVGEFIFAKSTITGNSFEVQTRHKAWGERTDVAITSAVAMNVNGDKVSFYLKQNPISHINGIPQQLTEGSTKKLPNGGQIVKRGNLYSITWADKHSLVEVKANSDGFATNVHVDDFYKGKLIGLLGNADGSPQNDLNKRDGTALGMKLDFATLYPSYADSWRISQQESLFDYAQGETTETFTDRNFPRVHSRADRLPADVRAKAEQICRAAGITNPTVLENCILDVALTGQAGFATDAADANAPKNVIDIVPPPTPQFGTAGFGRLSGSVLDAVSKQLVNGAQISVGVSGTPLPSAETSQTANGRYQSSVVPIGAGYSLEINAAGYISEQILNLSVPDRQIAEVETVNLVPINLDGKAGSISGRTRNALNDQPMANLTVQARRYINNRQGDPLKVTKTDSNGEFRLDGLNSGNYTLEFFADGVMANYFTATSIAGQNTFVDAVINPEMGNALYRVILSWNDTSDLDAHLTGPDGQNGRFHIYFNVPGSNNSEQSPYAWIDRDDKDGFGPETVSIYKLQNGIYRYSVHDYKNSASTSSKVLGSSGAKVSVYSRTGLMASYIVPNQEGTLWTVFEMSANGVVTPINSIGYEASQGGVSTLSTKSIRHSNDSVITDYYPITFQSKKH
jgi:hypothetical protein